MLGKVLRKFESDLPDTETIGAIVDCANWPNAKLLFEQGFLGALEQGDISATVERMAALEAQVAQHAEEKALQDERIAALEAQLAATKKSNK